MKATGLVRRMDDLGRVVIPKEVRRQLKIQDGDPLEVYIHNNGVYFQTYNNLTAVNQLVDNFFSLEKEMQEKFLDAIQDRENIYETNNLFR